MKKFVEREILTCSSFELKCNEYYKFLQVYHNACKRRNEYVLLDLLVQLGRFQGQLICFKVDNFFSSEEEKFLYNKSKRLVCRIKSRVLNYFLRMKFAFR